MAVSENFIDVQWSAASTQALNTGNSWAATSDATDFSATAFAAAVTIKCDQTTGTPASGDLVDFYLMRSMGDPDDSSPETGDEYPGGDADPSVEGEFLGQVDLNANDPGIFTVDLPLPANKFKIYAEGSGLATTDVATISAVVCEKLSA